MDNYDLLETVKIVQIIDKKHNFQNDVVIIETPLTIFINNQELVTLLCSPTHQINLAIGFLFSEGFFNSKKEIKNIILNKNRGIIWISLTKDIEMSEDFFKGRTITSGCARGLTFHKVFDNWNGENITRNLTIKAKTILDIAAELKQNSLLFQKSGGAHCATLYNKNRLLFSREDIGRHNAVDKIIGECIIEDISGEDKILMTSGRISSEILLKSARWKIPILISRTSPTSSAIKLAEEIGLTLIGFARGRRMNIYANSWRIK